jgi:hypothetical protein
MRQSVFAIDLFVQIDLPLEAQSVLWQKHKIKSSYKLEKGERKGF